MNCQDLIKEETNYLISLIKKENELDIMKLNLLHKILFDDPNSFNNLIKNIKKYKNNYRLIIKRSSNKHYFCTVCKKFIKPKDKVYLNEHFLGKDIYHEIIRYYIHEKCWNQHIKEDLS